MRKTNHPVNQTPNDESSTHAETGADCRYGKEESHLTPQTHDHPPHIPSRVLQNHKHPRKSSDAIHSVLQPSFSFFLLTHPPLLLELLQLPLAELPRLAFSLETLSVVTISRRVDVKVELHLPL